MGFAVDGPLVVPDGDPVEAALRSAVADGYDVVLTTGGTGLSPTDLTPEVTARVLDRPVAGLAEAVPALRGAHRGPAAGPSPGGARRARGAPRGQPPRP